MNHDTWGVRSERIFSKERLLFLLTNSVGTLLVVFTTVPLALDDLEFK